MSKSVRNSNALNSYIPTLTNYISKYITNGDRLTSKIIKRMITPRYQVQLGRYHVTEICGCLRRSFLERTHGHDETHKEIWIKQRGKALHRQLTYALRGWAELPIQMLIPYDDSNVTLVGYVDAYDPDERSIIEFKSTRFVNWQNKKGLLPHQQHILQIKSYFTIWTRCYNFPVKTLLIGYVDDETPPTWFEVEPQDVTAWLRERAMRLHNALLQDEMPDAEQNGLCNYCAFKHYCSIKTI